jgi:hypothetical protein
MITTHMNYRLMIFTLLSELGIPRECAICGNGKEGYSLHIHHRDGNPYNHSSTNLQVLCSSCHLKQKKTKSINDRNKYHREYSKKRYHSDPEYREKRKLISKQQSARIKSDPEANKRRYEYQKAYREKRKF